MSASRWSYVLFDLDGTVVNTIPLIIASYDHAMWQVLGEHVGPEEARGWIGQTLADTFHLKYPDHADALISSYIEFNLARMETLLEQYSGMRELLTDLVSAGIRIGVATSKRRSSAERTLALSGLAELIPVTVAMDDTALHKPRPEPLLLALERLGASADEAVYVGDAVFDVQAAHAAGLPAISVSWGAVDADVLAAAEPEFLVSEMDELRRLLLG